MLGPLQTKYQGQENKTMEQSYWPRVVNWSHELYTIDRDQKEGKMKCHLCGAHFWREILGLGTKKVLHVIWRSHFWKSDKEWKTINYNI